MKQIWMPIVFLCAFFFQPSPAGAVDYSGQWLGNITESNTQCKKLGKGKPGDYVITITQKGDQIQAMENNAKRPYAGVLQKPDHVVVSGTYADDGGYVTENVSITFSSTDSGSGKSEWRWSNERYSCGGGFSFTLRKLTK
jgi:hypothetical protein